jgi:hypothetical protein
MSRTLSQILIDANAYLDLDASLPIGSELTTRTNYANQAVWDATAVSQFKEFQKVYEVLATGASIPLPSGFREFMTAPRLLDSNLSWVAYEEITPDERYGKNLSDKYCYVLGSPAEGYTAVFNNITANCTLSITYQRYPSGMATLTHICELSDPQYVVSKLESYVLQSRRDERFPIKDAEAERKLRNMVGRGSKKPSGGTNIIRRTGQANYVLE